MTNEIESVVLPVACTDDSCGVVSPYRFWKDGSYKKVVELCWHPKEFPSVETIRREIEQAKEKQ